MGLHQLVFRLQLLRLGIKHDAEVGDTGVVAQACKFHRFRTRCRCQFQMLASGGTVAVLGECAIGIFERHQHGFFIGSQGRFGARTLHFHIGQHATEIECRPGDRWCESPGFRAAFAEIAERLRCKTGGAAEENARKQLGLAIADQLGLRCQIALGDDDVRAAPQQVSWITTGYDVRQHGQWLFAFRNQRRRLRIAAGQYGDAVARARQRGFQSRDVGAIDFQLRRCTTAVELGAASGLQAGIGDLQRFGLIVDIALADLQARFQSAVFKILTRHFGGDRNLCAPQFRLGTGEHGILRAHATIAAAEQTGFPADIETSLVVIAAELLCGRARSFGVGH